MLVEVFINGVKVLTGEGKIENQEEGEVELLVETEDGPKFVQVDEDKFNNFELIEDFSQQF